MFRGLIHAAEGDFPRMYSFSWRKCGTKCFIILEISRDALEIVSAGLNKDSNLIESQKEEFGFDCFKYNLKSSRYGFNNCSTTKQMPDGSVELSFELVFLKDKEAMQHLNACASTIHVIAIVLDSIPEKEINDPLPQFMHIATSCCKNKRGGHGANIHGEFNKDVKRYLLNHYKTKGGRLKAVLSALLVAAEKLSGKKHKEEKNRYWAEVRERAFLSIDCPGNACGLNTEENDEAYFLLKKGKNEEDIGMDLICHNVDGVSQQIVLIAALASLSDEVKKYYLQQKD